jgi:ABC-type glutathione transport system ATPase component
VLSTHETTILQTWCTRLIWLDQGRVREDGPVDVVLANYMREVAPLGGLPGEVAAVGSPVEMKVARIECAE